ncbi:hypothetical protein [Paraburkholderia phenazinium]|jgi:hypothetical protein|uniref:Uncharacterized protein n=1 Tax=Paraburkholderia phenazinium TaxID=60549 RepID=A0A1G7VQQ3_9BURK|nr:hypothetical protein [Paraburkholderia phenazinium]SDG62064.1 hypothetical protein SAMN05216466_104183 [Paraburkholderia phenazinium]
MKILAIRNYDRASDILRYAAGQGPLEHVARTAEQQIDRGYFTVVHGHHYGVYATPTGPVAFMDDVTWPVRKVNSSSELDPVPPGRRRFRLIIDGAIAYEVVFSPENAVVDNWSDDDTISDFFSWLHNSVTTDPKGRFFDFYTLTNT